MTSTETTTRRPDEMACPYLTPDDCFTFGDETEFGIQNADRPRATAISLYADEMGVSFAKVSCRVAYLRLLTRQESYAVEHAEVAANRWIDVHDPPLHLTEESGKWEWATPDGTVVAPPPELETVPDDWKPDEDTPVWEFCDKATPGAVKCWRLEVRK